ncbi:hypothetical protein EYF80_010586 [Liparis tanakae]|uniref:Uncharacterized protein n=1 Tax=Liparis tanakae TaxID=230148 RepID=A0A4Z2IN49_9TELE|nr:hypothetical protein EYF80_010586 [Liparis tanakae]
MLVTERQCKMRADHYGCNVLQHKRFSSRAATCHVARDVNATLCISQTTEKDADADVSPLDVGRETRGELQTTHWWKYSYQSFGTSSKRVKTDNAVPDSSESDRPFNAMKSSTSLQYESAARVCITSVRYESAVRVYSTSLQYECAVRVCGTSLRYESAARVCSTSLQYESAVRVCSTSVQYESACLWTTLKLIAVAASEKERRAAAEGWQDVKANARYLVRWVKNTVYDRHGYT